MDTFLNWAQLFRAGAPSASKSSRPVPLAAARPERTAPRRLFLLRRAARGSDPQLRHMPRKRVGEDEPRAGTLDMLSARSSSVRKRLGNDEKVGIEYIEASGDCFYLAMEAALSESEGWCPYFAVATQREVVASSMREETYQMYALMYQQQAEGAGTGPSGTCETLGECSLASWPIAARRRGASPPPLPLPAASSSNPTPPQRCAPR